MTKYGMAFNCGSTPSQLSTTLPLSHASPLSIMCHKLNGLNFLPLSQSVLMFICGYGKEDPLIGNVKLPDSSDATQSVEDWEQSSHVLVDKFDDAWYWQEFSLIFFCQSIFLQRRHNIALFHGICCSWSPAGRKFCRKVLLCPHATMAEDRYNRGAHVKMLHGWKTLSLYCWKQEGVQIFDGLACQSGWCT